MKPVIWWGITGSWRLTSEEVERDVREAVRIVMLDGGGIVTGGALNVDFFATDEALRHNVNGERLKVILPTSLQIYAAHFRNRAEEGVITHDQAEQLIEQLECVDFLGGLIEMDHTACTEESYYDRNTKVIDVSNNLLAFHVNGTKGVQDAIDKAEKRGMTVIKKTYNL